MKGITMKHTPTPWYFGHDKFSLHTPIASEDDPSGKPVASVLEKADAERIVACVNSCAGLNPEAIPELVQAARDARAILRNNENPSKELLLAVLQNALAKAVCE